MKKILSSLVLMLTAIAVARAQDIITTRNGEIEAKVLEITSTTVRYKRFNNLEGPTYSLSTKQILTIQYENGDVDTFNSSARDLQTKSRYLEGKKYKDYAKDYDSRTYFRQPGGSVQSGSLWLGVFPNHRPRARHCR